MSEVDKRIGGRDGERDRQVTMKRQKERERISDIDLYTHRHRDISRDRDREGGRKRQLWTERGQGRAIEDKRGKGVEGRNAQESVKSCLV